jgi:hypothetical protein
MVVKRQGKALEIFVEPANAYFREYCMVFKDLLGREFNPLKRISVETINNGPALHSPYVGILKDFGFHSGIASLDLWKQP